MHWQSRFIPFFSSLNIRRQSLQIATLGLLSTPRQRMKLPCLCSRAHPLGAITTWTRTLIRPQRSLINLQRTNLPSSPALRQLHPPRWAKLTNIFYIPSVLRPNSPPIVKSNSPDSSRLSWRGTPLPHQSRAAPPCRKAPSRSIAPRFRCHFRQRRLLSLLLISLLYPTRKGRVVNPCHGGKPCRTHARTIKGREYFLPLGKRCAHSSQAVLFENFPC